MIHDNIRTTTAKVRKVWNARKDIEALYEADPGPIWVVVADESVCISDHVDEWNVCDHWDHWAEGGIIAHVNPDTGLVDSVWSQYGPYGLVIEQNNIDRG